MEPISQSPTAIDRPRSGPSACNRPELESALLRRLGAETSARMLFGATRTKSTRISFHCAMKKEADVSKVVANTARDVVGYTKLIPEGTSMVSSA